jgi:hypothetical protein
MALQLNLTAEKTGVGVASPEAYARIVHLAFDTKTGKVTLSVDIHYDQAARAANKSPVSGGIYSGFVGIDMPSIDVALAEGVRAVLYAWLKTQADFTGATDV